ncbi:MAG: GNAT family N-acetyltransferase [Chloroflexi bacterium]|nr:GNAT family N-acetyltransferase [Chloroflexota bacterium]
MSHISSSEVEVRKTTDAEACHALAAGFPDYFTARGLEILKVDLAIGELYGAFAGDTLIGFALYKELNPEAVELAWLAVARRHWSRGVGTRLVNETLTGLPNQYRACEVKTLAATVPDAGYDRTRRFYSKLGFIPLEVIDPYPGWDPGNPCQILVRFLSR